MAHFLVLAVLLQVLAATVVDASGPPSVGGLQSEMVPNALASRSAATDWLAKRDKRQMPLFATTTTRKTTSATATATAAVTTTAAPGLITAGQPVHSPPDDGQNDESIADGNQILQWPASNETDDTSLLDVAMLANGAEMLPLPDAVDNATSTGGGDGNRTQWLGEVRIDGENGTCVGIADYCNYTREEYMEMLMAYMYPSWPQMLLIAAHVVTFTMGLVGNALVCLAVYTNFTMRTVTNIFIVNLAVADFFVILFCLPPTVLWDVTKTWWFGEIMCKVVLYFQTVSVTVSVLTLTFISIDRWYAICFPLRYVSTNLRAVGSIILIWVIALLSDFPEFLHITIYQEPLRFDIEVFTQCVVTWSNQTENIYNISRALLLYLIPLLMMSVAYFQIVRVLWRSDTIPGHRESRNTLHTCRYIRNPGPPVNSSTLGQLRARRKAAKMLVAVVVMFAVCFFPVHLLNILRSTLLMGQSETTTVLSLISHWMCYANSAVNPVIYNFMSGKFRREFRNALDKCRCVRVRIEDRFNHSHPACSRTIQPSPSSRSNYQLTSLRDLSSMRDRQASLHTSYAETSGLGAPGGAGGGGGGVGGGTLNGHNSAQLNHYQGGGHPLNRRLSQLQSKQNKQKHPTASLNGYKSSGKSQQQFESAA